MAGLDNVADIYPLTPVQKGMLFHTLAEPGSGMYVEQYSCAIQGRLRVPLFRQAWEAALARHPALRTAFLWQDLDEPLQAVREDVDLPWSTHDWRGPSPDVQAERWEALRTEDRARGFELMQAPLMRVTLVQTGDRSHRLLWTFHHLLLDGWSAVTVLREVWADYAARCDGDTAELEPPRPFRDYVAWHRNRDLEDDKAYWIDRLDGFQAPTPLHIDGESDTVQEEVSKPELDDEEAPTDRAERQITLSAHETDTAQAFAQQHRITLNTLVQGAWALLLSRYSGADDVVYGTTVSGRPSQLNGVESMVGAFINTVPMRVQVEPDRRPIDWLQEVQSALLNARSHAFAPLRKIQEWSPVPDGQDLFQSLLVFENHPPVEEHPAETTGIHVDEETFRGQSNYPLALLAIPGRRLKLTAVYDADRFANARIERLLDHFTTLIKALANERADELVNLPMLMGPERRPLRAASGEEASVPDEDDPDVGIHHLIERAAQETPTAEAVRFEDEALTYAELDARASKLAEVLRDRGVEAGDFVGLFVERSPEMVVGLLAILKAGAAYVPLDPTYPAQRLEHMIDDSGARVVVTTRDLQDEVPGREATVVCVNDVLASPATTNGTASTPSAPVDPEQPAYVIYTSGSTGTPKGVVVTHANLVFSTQARVAYYEKPPGVFLLLSPIGFDSSVAGLFWTLTTGGTLVVPRTGEEKKPRQIATLVQRHAVTHTLCVPVLYGRLLERSSSDELESLDTVIVAGEACPPALPDRHHEALPGTALFNEYGPTEATVWSTVHRVEADPSHSSVPIGRPIPGASAYVLDRHQRIVPPGVPGELYVGGPGVTPGYLNRPEETAERFLAFPIEPDGASEGDVPTKDAQTGERLYRTGDRVRADADGVLEFLGRIDNQVNLRGHRIEVGEIETALRQHDTVETGAVAVREISGTRQLVAYVVLVPSARSLEQMEDGGPSLKALRSGLRRQLPEHMVPAHIEFLEELPRTPNGKLDREALPTPSARQAVDDSERVEPSGAVEMQMLGIWQDLFDTRPLSMTDNFFHLGGDSLLAVTLTARIEDAFGVPVSTSALFNHPTPRALTEWIRSDVPATTSPVPVSASGSRPPLFCVPGSGGYPVLFYKLGTYLDADRPVYSFQPQGVDGRALPRTSIEAMAEQHRAEMQEVQPKGPYRICGFSVGGLVAYEMAQQLYEMGEKAVFLGLLDTRLHQKSWPQRWWARLKDDVKYWLRRREALSYLSAGRIMPRALRNSFPAKVHERAARRYTPQPYPGPADLFAATGMPEYSPDNAAAWADLIEGEFTVHEISASHDIVKEPYAGDLAERLAERLSSIDSAEDADASTSQPEAHAVSVPGAQ